MQYIIYDSLIVFGYNNFKKPIRTDVNKTIYIWYFSIFILLIFTMNDIGQVPMICFSYETINLYKRKLIKQFLIWTKTTYMNLGYLIHYVGDLTTVHKQHTNRCVNVFFKCVRSM